MAARIVTHAIALSAVLLAAPACAANTTLSDTDLAGRAAAVLSVKEPPADRVLGIHRGTMVFVDVLCSDVCPVNTVRVIHYQVEAGPQCTRLGGDSVSIVVPITIGARAQPYCIPHILYRRNLYNDQPYRK